MTPFRSRGLCFVAALMAAAGLAACATSGTARPMLGLYTHLADAAHFVDCTSGRRWPVLEDGDHAALQRAYAAARPAPGAPVRVEIEAQVVMHPAAVDAVGERAALRVHRVIAATAEVGCPNVLSTAPLQNTYWKLMTVGGLPVPVAEGQREPHVVLQTAPPRVVGFSGCNRMAGGYTLQGDRLSFSGLAGTRMACAQGMVQEQAFLDALARAAHWRIGGDKLDLLDEGGTVLATFESRHLQ